MPTGERLGHNLARSGGEPSAVSQEAAALMEGVWSFVTTNTLRVGIVGIGVQTEESLLPAYQALPGAEVVALVDVDHERAQGMARRWSVGAAFTSLDEMLGATEIDLVIIATPQQTHYGLALQALRADCHVMVEKPMAENFSQARELFQLADTRKRVLTVDYQYFYQVERVIDRIYAGLIGQPTHIRAWFEFTDAIPRRPGFWNTQYGGVIPDFLGHPLSAAIPALGMDQTPLTLTAQGWGDAGRSLLGSGFVTEDTASISIQCSGNAAIHVDVSWMGPRNNARLEIFGTEASLEIPLMGAETRRSTHLATLHRFGAARDGGEQLTDCPPTPTELCFLRHAVAVRDRIVRRTPLPFRISWALDVQMVIDAARESIRRAGTQVDIRRGGLDN